MEKYSITLTADERKQLKTMIKSGKTAARKVTHARILLKADGGPHGPAWTDVRISEAVDVTVRSVEKLRQRFVLEGFEAALSGKSTRNQQPHKLDGECEARLIAALCGPAPKGYARWSLRLLASKAVTLEIVDEPVSYETVRKMLKANELKPWLNKECCIPPEHHGGFVCQMEEILEVYRRPRDPKRPLVCMDEMPYQLISETRTPQALRRGRVPRYDYEYKREGVVNLFLVFAPLLGQRYVRVTARRTAKDWAALMRYLVDEVFLEAEKIVLVLDNLNTHVGGALYEAFPPAEARRILDKLEIHYTPKHGSWLNMAEIEFSVLSRQCLDRRIGTVKHLRREVNAWMKARNRGTVTVHWHFTVAEARIKLKHLYPVIEPVTVAKPPVALLPGSVATRTMRISRFAKRKRKAVHRPTAGRKFRGTVNANQPAKRRAASLRAPEL